MKTADDRPIAPTPLMNCRRSIMLSPYCSFGCSLRKSHRKISANHMPSAEESCYSSASNLDRLLSRLAPSNDVSFQPAQPKICQENDGNENDDAREERWRVVGLRCVQD